MANLLRTISRRSLSRLRSPHVCNPHNWILPNYLTEGHQVEVNVVYFRTPNLHVSIRDHVTSTTKAKLACRVPWHTASREDEVFMALDLKYP